MAIDRKPATIHYRRFTRENGVEHTLEKMVRDALDTRLESGVLIRERYKERVSSTGDDNYFINIYQSESNGKTLAFGDILHFTRGHLQALCRTSNDEASSVPVEQLPAPEQSEYVHSQMFWMIKGDHAFIIQSMSLQTETLERYLGWLLKEKTTQLPGNYPIVMATKFDLDEVGGDLSDIQEIVVGGVAAAPQPPVPSGTEERVVEVTEHGQINTARTTGFSGALDILKTLLGGEANVESLMKAVPEDAELNVQVHIGYKTRKRKVDRQALKQLETGLRNLPDSQLQIKSKGSKIGTDGSIRLHHNASIRLIKKMDGEKQIIGSLLDPTDVLRAMIEAYSTFVANGKIQA